MTNAQYWKQYKRDVKKIAKLCNYGTVYSYDDLFNGGTINAFGTKTNSAPTFHVMQNAEDKVTRFEITDDPKRLYRLFRIVINKPQSLVV